ncbi:ATP synthase F1 subunit epsilon [Myxococcota bacterium]|nr:ATP synthase F1 subunit epsilon [Myxococcota bacterium]
MSLQLRIVTPTGEALKTETTHVTLPGLNGEFTVLSGHLPFLTALRIGVASYATGKHTQNLCSLGKGFVEVFANQVTIFVQTAEKALDIDKKRAQDALSRAEKALSNSSHNPNDPSYQLLLEDRARAKSRLLAAEKAI